MRNYETINDVEEIEEVIEPDEIEEIEEVVEVEEVVEDDIKMGIVVGCAKLNVREKPDTNALCVDTINADEELMIVEADSTDEFYHVCNVAGIEGFCVKKYIDIM